MAYTEHLGGKKNLILKTGRIAYGGDGTDFYPLLGEVSGSSIIQSVVLSAGTASAGTVAVSSTKTIQTEIYAPTVVAATTIAISSVVDLTGVKRATFFIDHSKASTAAFTANGPEYRVEVSQQSSENDTWRAIASFNAGSAVAASAAASSDVAAGTTLVKITSGTAIPARDIICFTNPASSAEWVRSTIATGTASFNVQEATRFAHASATGLFAGAEHFVVSVDARAYTRARVVINNVASSGTQPILARAACITEV